MISKTVVVNLPADAEARPVAVLVQIASQVADLQPTGLKFAERPLEQRCVVRLEVDFPVQAQHTLVALQEGVERQAALGVLLARPRVAEVQVDQVHLARREVLLQFGGIDAQEIDVFQSHGKGLLHRQHQCLLHALHGDEQNVRLQRSRLDRELSLAAADLQPQLARLRHQRAPVAAQISRVLQPYRPAGLHPRRKILSFSHSHGDSLPDPFSFSCIIPDFRTPVKGIVISAVEKLAFLPRPVYNIRAISPGVAQFGRALRSGRRGRKFESCHADLFMNISEELSTISF